jgi:outer membrane immunogenic protein
LPNGQVAGGDLTSVTTHWDASLRGRLGVLVASNLMLYGTAGVAWQNVQVSGTCGPFAASFGCAGPPQPSPSSVSQTNTLVGWTVGAGAEWHAWGNWLIRGEYRYAGFGSSSFALPLGATSIDNTKRFSLNTSTQIATFGLVYKLY